MIGWVAIVAQAAEWEIVKDPDHRCDQLETVMDRAMEDVFADGPPAGVEAIVAAPNNPSPSHFLVWLVSASSEPDVATIHPHG